MGRGADGWRAWRCNLGVAAGAQRIAEHRAAHPPLPPSPPVQPSPRENSRTRGGNNGRKCRRKRRLHPCQPGEQAPPLPAPWTACYFLPSTSFWVIKYPHLPALHRPLGQPFRGAGRLHRPPFRQEERLEAGCPSLSLRSRLWGQDARKAERPLSGWKKEGRGTV